MMDIRLVTFLMVAKVRNFTRAGELLNLTQPAVSQHIRYLESHYGVSLLRKAGRFIHLTPEGELLYKYAKEMDILSAVLERELRNQSGIFKRYQVGATRTIGEYILPPILGEYKRIYPKTDILMQVHNTDDIINKLLRREIDLALVEGPFDVKKFIYRKFMDDELVLALSPHSEMTRKKEISMDEILAGNLIVREEGSGTRKVFENTLEEAGYSIAEMKAYMEIGSIQAIKSLVQSNLGYTIISKKAIKAEVNEGTLQIVPIKGMTIKRAFHFIYQKEGPSDFINAFIQFCSTYADAAELT